MIIRNLQPGDKEELKKINAKENPNDSFPDFDKLNNVRVITTRNNQIITAGGVELIAEGVCITDKTHSEHVRGKALKALLLEMLFTCSNLDQNYLHVFSNNSDEVWERALVKHNFKSAGKAFYIGV